MKITISRYNSHTCEQNIQEFSIEPEKSALENFVRIKSKEDNTLSFRCGCRSGVCGSCAIRVDGKEVLACKTKLKIGNHVEPIKTKKILRDLVVELDTINSTLKASKAFLEEFKTNETITKNDESMIDTQSNCILCQSCYSSCPVYEVNENFLGPYALTRVFRYIEDKKEANISTKIEAIQNSGVWDCTLCGNCTMVCPQFIDPKTDILNLQMKSSQFGYTNPNFQNFSMGFDANSGFNPNGF